MELYGSAPPAAAGDGQATRCPCWRAHSSTALNLRLTGGRLVGVLQQTPTAPLAPTPGAGEDAEQVAAGRRPGVEVGAVELAHTGVTIGPPKERGEVVVVLAALHAHQVLATLVGDQLQAAFLCDRLLFADLLKRLRQDLFAQAPKHPIHPRASTAAASSGLTFMAR